MQCAIGFAAPPGLEDISPLCPEAVAADLRERRLVSAWLASSAEVTGLLLKVVSAAQGGFATSGGGMVSATAETPTMTPKMSEKAAASEDMASTNDSGTRDLTDVVSDSGSDGPATTLMVRNIPPAYTEDMLMEEWPMDLGYDFFYLPRNNKGKVNLGYAFLNFVSETHAEAFRSKWEKARLANFDAPKRLNISLAEVQGLEANVQGVKEKSAGRLRTRQCQPFVVREGRRLRLDEV